MPSNIRSKRREQYSPYFRAAASGNTANDLSISGRRSCQSSSCSGGKLLTLFSQPKSLPHSRRKAQCSPYFREAVGNRKAYDLSNSCQSSLKSCGNGKLLTLVSHPKSVPLRCKTHELKNCCQCSCQSSGCSGGKLLASALQPKSVPLRSQSNWRSRRGAQGSPYFRAAASSKKADDLSNSCQSSFKSSCCETGKLLTLVSQPKSVSPRSPSNRRRSQKRERYSPYFRPASSSKKADDPSNGCQSSSYGGGKLLTLVSQPKWVPPRSPHKLIQESLFHDPWKLLVATIFLQRAVPLAIRFLERWNTPELVLEASAEELAEFLQPLGLNNRRARVLQNFTSEYIFLSFFFSSLSH